GAVSSNGDGIQEVMGVNFSQGPMASRLAISAAAPAFSATTYLLLTVARRLIVPSPLVIRANVSHEPAEARLAISGSAPAFSAQTYMLFARDRSATLPPPRSTRSNRS